MSLVSCFLLALVSLLPPLSADERLVLVESVRDDTGLVESAALEVLLNHVAGWDAAEVAGSNLPNLVLELILADPEQFRGDPFLVRGELLRRDRRALGRDDLEAWIILPEGAGDDEGQLLAVLVPSSDAIDVAFADLPQTVLVPTRFFARLLVAASTPGGAELVLPLLVGNFPVGTSGGGGVGGAGAGPNVPTPVLVLVLLVVLAIFTGLRFYLRRQRRRGRGFAAGGRYDDEMNFEVAELPEEPAEALGVLHEFNQPDEVKR